MTEDPAGLERDPHWAACPSCRKALIETRKVHSALAGMREEDPSPDLRKRVMRSLPKPGGGIPRLLWFALPIAAVLGLLPFLMKGKPVQAPGTPGPSGTASIPPAPQPPDLPPAARLSPLPEPKPVPTPPPSAVLPEPQARIPEPEPLPRPAPSEAAPVPASPEPEPVVTPPAEEPEEPEPALAVHEDLASLKLAALVQGPPASTDSLAGNVVLVEFWGPG